MKPSYVLFRLTEKANAKGKKIKWENPLNVPAQTSHYTCAHILIYS